MKKFHSTIMLLAMMVAALSFTACGGDDKDEIDNGIYSFGDFIEVTIDGKTYLKKMIGIYSQVSLGANDMVLTGTTENVFEDEGFRFFIGLTHSEKKDKLLSSPIGNYSVSKGVWIDDEPENLCFFVQYRKDRHEYKLSGGSHKVTSINQIKNGVQVCGTFNVTVYYDDDTVNISGKYGMTVLK